MSWYTSSSHTAVNQLTPRQIYTAEKAFGRNTGYPRMAPGQLSFNDAIALAMQDIDNNMVAAMRKEDRDRFINA